MKVRIIVKRMNKDSSTSPFIARTANRKYMAVRFKRHEAISSVLDLIMKYNPEITSFDVKIKDE
jgi:hypothetical protein